MIAYALRTAAVVTGDSKELQLEVARISSDARWHRFVFGPPQRLFERESVRKPVIVSSRRLTAEMRVDRIIDAFLSARKASPELGSCRLTVCGDGSLRGHLIATRSDPMVDYLGQVSTQTLQELLLTARAFVSIPITDGTSAALLEAMAAGTLPIVNSIPANLEWVSPDYGEIVPRDPSVAELAHAMTRAFLRDAETESLRAAVKNAAWEPQVAALIEMYDALISRAN
jgi:glycosyltransferase involved in cell wall biosynthesis